MARVTDKFVSRVLNQMLLEAVKNLNIVADALEPTESEVKNQLDEAVKLITRIQV